MIRCDDLKCSKGAEVMGSKGNESKRKILEIARTLFAKKGFSAVSMQDICKESGLSRGGLYRHFSSTEEIFIDIILEEQSAAFRSFDKAKADGVSPEVMLFTFIRSRVSRLTEGESFDNAISEFAANSEQGKEILKNRALTSVEIMTGMIDEGCKRGSFSCKNPKAAATQILWVLEGMSKHNALISLSSEEIEEQLVLINKLLN